MHLILVQSEWKGLFTPLTGVELYFMICHWVDRFYGSMHGLGEYDDDVDDYDDDNDNDWLRW